MHWNPASFWTRRSKLVCFHPPDWVLNTWEKGRLLLCVVPNLMLIFLLLCLFVFFSKRKTWFPSHLLSLTCRSMLQRFGFCDNVRLLTQCLCTNLYVDGRRCSSVVELCPLCSMFYTFHVSLSSCFAFGPNPLGQKEEEENRELKNCCLPRRLWKVIYRL